MDCRELERKELDLVIMAEIMAGIHDKEVTTSQEYGHGYQQRKLTSVSHYHRGHRICRNTFLKLHGIGMLKRCYY